MNIQLSSLALLVFLMSCQAPVERAEAEDPIHKFLESEVARLDKILERVAKDFEDLEEAEHQDDLGVLSMKSAAIHRHRFALRNERSAVEQEKKFLQLQARRRAVSVRKRGLASQTSEFPPDAAEEYEKFLTRYRPAFAE